MREGERRRDNPSQEWQKADARILGQILAAQNVVFTLPDMIRIAEFYAQILISIPGIAACRVCLGGRSVQAGEMASGVCAECETLRHSAWEEGPLIPTTAGFRCSLADQPGMRVIAIDSYQHHFGFFVFRVDPAGVGALYQPFISNLSSYVALILENRWQKDLLLKANDELERKVKERTHELIAANEALAASHLAALDMMQAAVEARRRAEQASADLLREIAEHKQVEREYRTLIESVPDPIVRYDSDLRRIYVNPAWEKASGLSAAEVIGVDCTDIPKVPSPVNLEYLKKLRQVLELGASQTAEFIWENANGVGLFLEYVMVPEYDNHGKIAGLLAVGRDITERKRMEEELSKYREHLEELVRQRTMQLEQANKELEAFAYSVSHDLRAPLRHIDGFIGLLQKKAAGALDEQGRHYMDAISGSANKMGRLIDDLLSFSRMGRQAMSFQPVDLGTLVREVISELAPDAAGRTIDWRIGDLPAVRGDGAMLRMVLTNLIANALKFTRPRQSAQIEVGSLPGQASEAVIFVRDNGVGLDMAYADNLFGVFQRLHRAEEFEGTGIGLATVRRIVARHGGRTWAEGNVNQGATFYFSLPHTPHCLGKGMPNHGRLDPRAAPGR
jgi:PAS domain S-box-containing protein